MIIKWIIVRFTNDWTPVWAEVAHWTIENQYDYGYTTKETAQCSYTIVYSRVRNQYKLELRGHNPYKHRYCKHAVDKLNEFTKPNIITNITEPVGNR